MRRSGLAMLVAALVAACSSTPPPTAPSSSSGSAAPSASAPTVTASPVNTASSPASTPAPTMVTPSTTASPDTTGAPLPVTTPEAVMLVNGAADGHAGRLGAYTFQQLAVDAPWLPARMLQGFGATAGASLSVRFTDGSLIGDWSIAYAAAADTEGATRHSLGASEDTIRGSTEVMFAAPPTGDWVVAAHLFYPAELGSGVYYWHLTVGP